MKQEKYFKILEKAIIDHRFYMHEYFSRQWKKAEVNGISAEEFFNSLYNALDVFENEPAYRDTRMLIEPEIVTAENKSRARPALNKKEAVQPTQEKSNVLVVADMVLVVPEKRDELFTAINYKIDEQDHVNFQSLIAGNPIANKIKHKMNKNQLADTFGKLYSNNLLNTTTRTVVNKWLEANFVNYTANTQSFSSLSNLKCAKPLIKISSDTTKIIQQKTK